MKVNVWSKHLLSNNGFTLIEVMLAMAIFSIAGVALLGTANTNFTNMSLLEEKMLASWVASNQLVEGKLARQWPPQNNKKGTQELSEHKWSWTQRVVKTADDNMRAVYIDVRKKAEDEKAITSLMTYVSKAN